MVAIDLRNTKTELEFLQFWSSVRPLEVSLPGGFFTIWKTITYSFPSLFIGEKCSKLEVYPWKGSPCWNDMLLWSSAWSESQCWKVHLHLGSALPSERQRGHQGSSFDFVLCSTPCFSEPSFSLMWNFESSKSDKKIFTNIQTRS